VLDFLLFLDAFALLTVRNSLCWFFSRSNWTALVERRYSQSHESEHRTLSEINMRFFR
jgi:hypothetical protein